MPIKNGNNFFRHGGLKWLPITRYITDNFRIPGILKSFYCVYSCSHDLKIANLRFTNFLRFKGSNVVYRGKIANTPLGE